METNHYCEAENMPTGILRIYFLEYRKRYTKEHREKANQYKRNYYQKYKPKPKEEKKLDPISFDRIH